MKREGIREFNTIVNIKFCDGLCGHSQYVQAFCLQLDPGDFVEWPIVQFKLGFIFEPNLNNKNKSIMKLHL